jgi:glyoxylase-like metal-dependent hydrolase (beta-lactamase superfamily II)
MFNKLMRLVKVFCFVLIAFVFVPQGHSANAAEGPVRKIIKITGNLYYVRAGFHNTVFLVTPKGIILADPISVAVSQWLKTEFSQRFGSTVKYVIYSHHHPDHASGGTVFTDTATFVGHQQVATALNEALPRDAAPSDLNGDGRLSKAEATDHAYPAHFDTYDRNGDGFITGVEINADIPRPNIVYADHMTITLGGSRVELMHPGSAHSEDQTVMLFPEQRAVFAVDFLHVKRFPSTLYGYPVAKYVDAIAKVQSLDFDILIPGHGNVGEKADLILFVSFLRALDAAVASGIAEGKSLEEMRKSIFFPDYKNWLLYDVRRVNLINEVYELLTKRSSGQ